MIRTVPDDEHQRRRVYFALHDLALKLYALEPNDRMIGYILGLIDERERHEKEILPRAELLRASRSIRGKIGWVGDAERR